MQTVQHSGNHPMGIPWSYIDQQLDDKDSGAGFYRDISELTASLRMAKHIAQGKPDKKGPAPPPPMLVPKSLYKTDEEEEEPPWRKSRTVTDPGKAIPKTPPMVIRARKRKAGELALNSPPDMTAPWRSSSSTEPNPSGALSRPPTPPRPPVPQHVPPTPPLPKRAKDPWYDSPFC